jgi:hypothetical protein
MHALHDDLRLLLVDMIHALMQTPDHEEDLIMLVDTLGDHGLYAQLLDYSPTILRARIHAAYQDAEAYASLIQGMSPHHLPALLTELNQHRSHLTKARRLAKDVWVHTKKPVHYECIQPLLEASVVWDALEEYCARDWQPLDPNAALLLLATLPLEHMDDFLKRDLSDVQLYHLSLLLGDSTVTYYFLLVYREHLLHHQQHSMLQLLSTQSMVAQLTLGPTCTTPMHQSCERW